MLFLAFAEQIQLLPDGSLIIHVIMILAMIWILNRTFFRPINRIIEKREKNKGGHSSEAVEILEEASEKRVEYTQGLQESRSEGYELIESERAEALSEKQSKVETAKEEIAAMVENENADLTEQVESAKGVITEEAEKMAEKISSNVLGGVA